MNVNGEQMGGCVGFLKTLRKLVSDIKPSAVYVAWEGGGSTKRRGLFSEYKMNRKPQKLNRFYEDDIPESDENKQRQLVILLALLKASPVCQLYVSDCEGDDVIAYLCRGEFRNKNKVIASSDKDLFQLLDDKTMLYNLHRKTYLKKENVLEEFRVTSHNFALAKALCGDASDNIPGIRGLGFKKVAKAFPFLGLENEVLLQDVFDFCSAHTDEGNIYERVLKQADDVKRNWRLVHLDGGMLSPEQASRIDHAVKTFAPRVDKMRFMRKLIEEGINDFDVSDFFYVFNCIDGLGYATRGE